MRENYNRGNDMDIINIYWQGPVSLEDIQTHKELNDENEGYGVYQIYGTHPVYGHDVLLYIGKAARQTFKKRLSQEEHWWYNAGAEEMKIYYGKLIGKTPSEEEWEEMIAKAEQLLIHAHRPAHNSSNINSVKEKKLQNTHVLNWGSFRNLLPEVSSMRIFDETKEKCEDFFTLEN